MKKTKALLIGINDYSPAGTGGPDLNGCVNDVRDMANTLVICGFEPKNIRIITDSRATRNEILSSLNDLVKNLKADESAVFYYSGHGSYKIDLDGDEPDGRDELLCPHDWPQHILDDELAACFKNIPPGANLEVFMDCCFSGTNTRAALSLLANDQKVLVPRFISPPFDITFYEEFKVTSAIRKARVIVPVAQMNHVLWAACKENQVSNETEIDHIVRGIFTYHLCSVLRASSGNITRKKLDALVTASVARHGFDQTPQLEAKGIATTQNVFC